MKRPTETACLNCQIGIAVALRGPIPKYCSFRCKYAADAGFREKLREKSRDAARAKRETDPAGERIRKQRWRELNAGHVQDQRADYYRRNAERIKAKSALRHSLGYSEKYLCEHRVEINARNRQRNKVDREVLGPRYISQVLELPMRAISPDLLLLKQQQLSIYRLARQLRKAANESSEDSD